MPNRLTATVMVVVVCHALLSYAVFALALTAQVSSAALGWSVVAALGVTALVAGRLLRLAREEPSTPVANRDMLILVVGTLLIVAPFVHVLALPPFHEDDLIYHLNVPKRLLQAGGLVVDPFNVNTNFPMLFEMPLTALMVSKGALSPLAVNVVYLFMLALAVAAYMRFDLQLGLGWTLLTTWAFAWIPLHYAVVQSCYVEIFLALLIFLGLQMYMRSLGADGKRRDWFWAMFFLGLGAATKYLGLLPLGAVVLAEIVRRAERRRLGAGIVLAAAVSLPWYVKNWVLLGNPFYPFMPQLFPTADLSVDRYLAMKKLFEFYNEGTGLSDYLLLPLRLLRADDWELRPGAFGFGGKLSLLCGLTVFGLSFKGVGARTVSGMVVVYGAFWVFSSQNVRYLLPFLTMPMALGVRFLLGKGPWGRCLVALLVALAIGQNAGNIWKDMRDSHIDDVVMGRLRGEDFLAIKLPRVLTASILANRHLDPRHDKVLFIGGFGRSLYIDAKVLANTFADVEIFAEAFTRGAIKPAVADAFFAKHGITHLLLIDTTARKLLETVPDLAVAEVDRYLMARTELVEAQGGASLLALRP